MKKNKKTEKSTATTSETFATMRKEIERYLSINSFGKSKEELSAEYEKCIEIIKTLTKRELILLWHIRKCGGGAVANFARVAEKLYIAQKAFEALTNDTKDSALCLE